MTASARPGPLLVITAVIFILLGLALAGGGAWLVSLGGSWYYVVAGIGMLVAGALVWNCLLYTSPSPRDRQKSRMPSSA